MALTIISKNYEHYNRAMGKHIRSKQHYQEEMRKGGFVSADEGNRLAEKHSKEQKWKPSNDCINVIKAIKGAADKNGNIVLGNHPKIVEAMKKKGMSFDMSKLPKEFKETGGIEDAV